MTKLLRAFYLGTRDGIAQPHYLTSGMTWTDGKMNEVYDRGVNVGQALARFLPVLLTLGAREPE
jgi:hypothetical protein